MAAMLRPPTILLLEATTQLPLCTGAKELTVAECHLLLASAHGPCSRGAAARVQQVLYEGKACALHVTMSVSDPYARQLQDDAWLRQREAHVQLRKCSGMVQLVACCTPLRVLLLQWAAGSTLEWVLQQGGQQLTTAWRLRLAVELCQAMQAMHKKGWLHMNPKSQHHADRGAGSSWQPSGAR